MTLALYQGTAEQTWGFTGCGKTRFSEGYGLQPVRKYSGMNAALAAEGSGPNPTRPFSAASLAPADVFFEVAGNAHIRNFARRHCCAGLGEYA
jgi:hypothetical protein